MKFEKRNVSVSLTLERCRICGQHGELIVNGKIHRFATTDGMGEFFGKLMGIMCTFLGCLEACDQKYLDKRKNKDGPDKHVRIYGNMHCDYLGAFWDWQLERDVEGLIDWREETEVLIHVTEDRNDGKKQLQGTLTVSIRDLAYAVAKCATEVIKREGFFGYYHMAEGCEDFNTRHLLYLKAYALGVLDEMKYTTCDGCSTSLDDELDLLMFDM